MKVLRQPCDERNGIKRCTFARPTRMRSVVVVVVVVVLVVIVAVVVDTIPEEVDTVVVIDALVVMVLVVIGFSEVVVIPSTFWQENAPDSQTQRGTRLVHYGLTKGGTKEGERESGRD